MKKSPEAVPVPHAMAPILLASLSAALIALALFQWMELLVLNAGGGTVCAVSETVNCETVWNSPFANAVQGALGLPLAGLGLVYGVVAFALSLVLVHRLLAGRDAAAVTFGLRFTALVGLAVCVVLAIASFMAKALCLTCLSTYVLVIGFAVVAFKLLPGTFRPSSSSALKRGLAMTVAFAVGAYLLALPAGLASPKPSTRGESLAGLPAGSAPGSGTAAATDAGTQGGASAALSGREGELAAFLASLPANEQLLVSRALARYRAAPSPVASLPPPRFFWGSANAPVRLVEWTDIRCGHCRSLVEAMQQIKRAAPAGSLQIEPRHFPLDGTCNPAMPNRGPGTSCVAAKAQICLEGAPDYWALQEKLFAAQSELTPESALTIASSGSVPRAKLEACMASAQTQQKLKEDIDLALKYQLQGTPLVVVNGKEAMPIPSFLYALAVTGGNAQSEAFAKLPPPPPEPQGHDGHDHAGHAH